MKLLPYKNPVKRILHLIKVGKKLQVGTKGTEDFRGSFVAGSAGGSEPPSDYYTKTELDAGQLDNRYYTETELDAGQLDNRYYTETELDAGQLNNLYYTEGEVDALLAALTIDRLTSTNSTLILTDDATDQTLTGNLGDLSIIANTELKLKASQDIKLETTGNDFDTTITSNTTLTNGLLTTLKLCAKTSANMVATFGGKIEFLVTDSGVTENMLGFLAYRRENADNTGAIDIAPVVAGTPGTTMTISGQYGGVGIGTMTPAEELHVSDKIRADTCFNVNGTDGITRSGVLSIVILDALMQTHTFTFLGGILTGYTKVP